MSDINITRNQLARICHNDLRSIRAFENLFNTVPTNNDTNTNTGLIAIAKANQANTQSIKNERVLKGSKVLTWLSM